MDKLVAVADKPLSVEGLQERPQAFSKRIFIGLNKNPLFRPRLKQDGTVTDHDMLIISATIVSAADNRIEELERKSSVLNGPMFSTAKLVADAEEVVHPNESSWFLRYLTLRNFLSVAVVIIAGLWAYYTYTTSDKNWQIESKQKDIESLQKEKKQLEDDTAYWQGQIAQYKDAATDSAKKEADTNVKYQSLKATEDAEHKELETARSQIKSLTAAVQKQADAAAK